MALDQHLYVSCRGAKIAIDLKWGMRIKEIWVRTTGTLIFRFTVAKYLPNHFVCMVAIQKPSCKINFPSLAPPGAFIATQLKCFFGCLRQFGRGQGGDGTTGMKSKQV